MEETINLNDIVRVRLTDIGVLRLEEEHRKYSVDPKYSGAKADEEGHIYFETELWNLMSIFGQYLYNGGPNYFDMNIAIVKRNS